jgi:uncharacterized protein
MIDAESAALLDKRIRALQQASGDVIVVATVRTFRPYATIDEYTVKMFENGGRGIGQKGKDNGALIVVAQKEKQIRIEVGYDLEEFITDGFAGATIREVITPEFRRSRFGPGLVAGATRLITRVAERRGVELQDVPRAREPLQTPTAFRSWWVVIPILWILIVLFLGNRRDPPRRRWGGRTWSGWNSGVGPFGGGFGGFGGGFGGFGGRGGGLGGGGFGGFGGGRSGGGGASGGW